MILDDLSGAELERFWQKLPTRVRFPVAEPDPLVLARLRFQAGEDRAPGTMPAQERL